MRWQSMEWDEVGRHGGWGRVEGLCVSRVFILFILFIHVFCLMPAPQHRVGVSPGDGFPDLLGRVQNL